MTPQQFIASLNTEQRRSLTRKSNIPGLLRLALHWSSILVIGWLIGLRIPLWPLLLPVQGVLIVFLFTLLHESIHRTAFRTGWLNQMVARVCSLFIALPVEWFRQFHFAHHRYTQDSLRDPELSLPKPTSKRAWLWQLTGIPVWMSHLKILGCNATKACQDPFIKASSKSAVRHEAQGMLIMYVLLGALSIVTGQSLLLWTWIIPALIGQPMLRIYLWAEHTDCADSTNVFANTRTTLTHPLLRLLAWNMPFHAEHHAFPGVPFHRLPNLHQLTHPHLIHLGNGYKAFAKQQFNQLSSQP